VVVNDYFTSRWLLRALVWSPLLIHLMGGISA
jgi:hypothetical protein